MHTYAILATAAMIISCMIGSIKGKFTASISTINLPSAYSAWTIQEVIGTSKGFQIMSISQSGQTTALLVDGFRQVQESSTAFIELNLDSQIGYSALKSDNLVYAVKSDSRHSVQATDITANEALFSIGKWTVLRSTDPSKVKVFNTTGNHTKSEEFTYSQCSIINKLNCSNGGDNKIYCLESNEAGTEQYLIYYTMPSCERLGYTARITRKFPAGTMQTISVEGQLLSICSTSKTALNGSCNIFDLNSSLFTLGNPDTAQPIKTVDYSLSTNVTEVLRFKYVLEWGCAFYVATTSSANAWNVFYKCVTDSSQGSISTVDLVGPVSSVAFNIGGKSISFKASASSIIEAQFTKNEDTITPSNCARYNSEISLCFECNPYTTLQSQGFCSEPRKSFLEKEFYDVSVERHFIKIDFKFKDDVMKELVKNNTNTLDFLFFEKQEVAAAYNMKIVKSEPTFDLKDRLRIKLWPNQTVDSLDTKFGIRINGYVPLATKRVLQDRSNRALQKQEEKDIKVDLSIPPYYYASEGQKMSFSLLFNHIYTLVFFVKLYLILVRPFVNSWANDPLQLWLTHFVISIQTLFLFGFNSLSLKGLANDFFKSAAEASFRFMSWDAVPNRDPDFASYYYHGGFSEVDGQPAFIKELVVFFAIYIFSFAGGILSPWGAEKLQAVRTATLLCYLPQVWYMFFTGAFNMLHGRNYTLLNYFSFAVSVLTILVVLVDCIQLLLPALRSKLVGLFGNEKQGIAVMYDILDYFNRQDKIPVWYHIDIIMTILVGTILGVTFNSGTTQAALLFVVYLLPIGVYLYHFKISTNRRLTKFKFASSITTAIFMLLAILLHTKNSSVGSVAFLAIIMMGLFILTVALHLAMALLRVVDIFCGNQVVVNHTVKDAVSGVQVLIDGQRRDTPNEAANVSSMKYASILDRYLQPDQSRVVNDSKNDSEMHVRILDNSLNRALPPN